MLTLTPQVERISTAPATLGESVVWNAADNAILWVDIVAGQVLNTGLSTGTTTATAFPEQAGFVQPATDGTWLVGQHDHILRHDPGTGESLRFASLKDEPAGNRTNDAMCDRSGNLWVGTMNLPVAELQPTGNLYRIDAKAAVSTLDTGLYIPNGIAFSPDGKTAYWADTYKTRRQIWQAEYEAANGILGPKSPFIQFADGGGRPDGATVDASGCYWIASVWGWQLLRYTPRGDLDLVVQLPVERPSKLAFGGTDLKTIFISTISEGLGPDAPAHQPLAGHLLAINLGIEGLPTSLFGSQ